MSGAFGRRSTRKRRVQGPVACARGSDVSIERTTGPLPPLSKPDADGNYPAVEYARASPARKIIRGRVKAGLSGVRKAESVAGVVVSRHAEWREASRHVGRFFAALRMTSRGDSQRNPLPHGTRATTTERRDHRRDRARPQACGRAEAESVADARRDDQPGNAASSPRSRLGL